MVSPISDRSLALSSIAHPPHEKGTDLVEKIPRAILGGAIAPFLSPKEFTACQITSTTTAKILYPFVSLMKTYPYLQSFIQKYLFIDPSTLSLREKNKALNKFIHFVDHLSGLEYLKSPGYSTLGEFFQLV